MRMSERHDGAWPKPDIVSSPFLITARIIAVIVYLDIFNVFSTSSLGTENLGKYPYFLWALASYGYARVATRRRMSGLTPQTMLFVLALAALVPFAWQLVTRQEPASFASAFASMLIFCISDVFDISRYGGETDRLRRMLRRLLVLLCTLYVIELVIRKFSGLPYFDIPVNETNHTKSLVFVAALCFSYVENDRRMFWQVMLLFVTSLVLRPSSTVVLAVAVCLPLAVAVRRGRLALAESIAYGVVVLAAVVPLVLYAVPDAEQAILYVEASIKEDFLQGHSNTLVRIAIQNMAFARIQDGSLLFGEMFGGPNTVYIAHILPWWRQNNPLGFATIHSDYVTILLEGGLVGYAWFTAALVLAVRNSFRSVRHALAVGENPSLAAVCHTAVIVVAIYCSSNPFLQYFGASHGAWMVMCLSVIGSRIIEGRAPAGGTRPLDVRADALPVPGRAAELA